MRSTGPNQIRRGYLKTKSEPRLVSNSIKADHKTKANDNVELMAVAA